MAQRQKSLLPVRKVWAGGLAGLVAWAVSAGLRQWRGWDIPADLVELFVLTAAGGVAYLVPPAPRDAISRLDQGLRRLGAVLPAALIVGLALALSACNPATWAALGAAGTAAAGIAATIKGGTVVLGAVARAACAAQESANAAGDIALSLGDAEAASRAARASTAIGALCSWANPA